MTTDDQTISLEKAVEFCRQLIKQQNFSDCLKVTEKIINIQPTHLDAKYLSSICYRNLGDYAASERTLKECIELCTNAAKLYGDLAYIYELTNNLAFAAQAYEKAISIEPDNIASLNNLANLYSNTGDDFKAIACFMRIISLGVEDAFIFCNMANIYRNLGQLNEAEEMINRSLVLNQKNPQIFHSAALIFSSLKKYTQAVGYYTKAYELTPENLTILLEYNEIVRKICDWKTCKKLNIAIAKLLKNNNNLIVPPLISIVNDINPELNLEYAKNYTDFLSKEILKIHQPFEHAKRKKNKAKIRIAYISADIKRHPVAYLMRGIFENHNKQDFEVFLYSPCENDDSGYSSEIETYCDKVINIGNLSSYNIAKVIYEDKIDILIDLNGHTGNTWLPVLALKPAPVQVSYLGFIGSMGADFIDYVITDKIVTPPEQQKYYTEKFAYLPNCYQANDNKLKISDKEITRKTENLPEDAVIFCSFNQSMKIEPVMFKTWMNILDKVENSVLWLFGENFYDGENLVEQNLKKEAKNQGIDPNRLIFAKYAPLDEHLKRTSLADLALDTRIYNGGTVTSQTLWAGVPVITLKGGHFASRMASSILNAVGLGDLVSESLKDYQNIAIDLGNNPEELQMLKKRLKDNKSTCHLFDTQGFTRNLEELYKNIITK